MQDSGFVAVGGAGKGLEAIKRDGGDESVVRRGLDEASLATSEADGLGVVVVEDQTVDIAGQVFDYAGGVALQA